MRFWDILREFMWLCEGVCNLYCMCYKCYTESKSYGYAIVDPFGRFAPSVLLRSFRYAKLRLRALPCAQDDTFGLSWSRMRAVEGAFPVAVPEKICGLALSLIFSTAATP